MAGIGKVVWHASMSLDGFIASAMLSVALCSPTARLTRRIPR
jgi:hypothetical protein